MTTLIVGLGHPDRGDDAVGLEVGWRLTQYPLDDVHVQLSTTGLLPALEDAGTVDRLVVIDAVFAGAVPGTLHRLDLRDLGPGAHTTSTHGLGLAGEAALADQLGLLPRNAVLLGVEIAQVELGAPISGCVAERIPDLVAAALAEALLDDGAAKGALTP